jgi:hypothetical protein
MDRNAETVMAKTKICVALQGEGAHGAFSWGVLDRLLEEESLEIQAVSGTSAGAMNGAVLVDALKRGGRQQARERLERFWRSSSEAADNIFKPGRMLLPAFGPNSDWSPMALWPDVLSVVWSPYDNPFYVNALRSDQLIVWVNPLHRHDLPTNARDILDRLNEVTFNATLVQEIEAIDAVNELKPPGDALASPYKRIRLHEIKDEPALARLGHASKSNTDWNFLLELREFGRHAAKRWLKTDLENVGRKQTADISRALRCLETR